jgi:hypothetical protein
MFLDRFNPLMGGSRIQSLLSHHDDEPDGPRVSTTNANMFLQDDTVNEQSSPVPHEDQSLTENESALINEIDQGVMQLPPAGRLNVVPRVAQDLLGRINFSPEDVALINELLMVCRMVCLMTEQ